MKHVDRESIRRASEVTADPLDALLRIELHGASPKADHGYYVYVVYKLPPYSEIKDGMFNDTIAAAVKMLEERGFTLRPLKSHHGNKLASFALMEVPGDKPTHQVIRELNRVIEKHQEAGFTR